MDARKSLSTFNAGLIAALLLTAWLPGCSDMPRRTLSDSSAPSATRVSFQGDRIVIGVVRNMGEEIEVDIGEMQPLYLPLKQAREKGFDSITKGDKLGIVLNDQNLLVNFYPLDAEPTLKVVNGQIAQPLVIGHDWVVILMANGREDMFQIRPAARSKMASISIGTPALFLLDETKQIVDVALDHSANGTKQSPSKGAHQRIEGTIVEPLSFDQIRIRTDNGSEARYEVRPMAQDKLTRMVRGQSVILLIDTDDKVIDVAVPPGRG
jgi:hypothetical protein